MDCHVIGAVIGRGNINNKVPGPLYATGHTNTHFSSAVTTTKIAINNPQPSKGRLTVAGVKRSQNHLWRKVKHKYIYKTLAPEACGAANSVFFLFMI